MNRIIINIITDAKHCVNHVIYDVFNIILGPSLVGERIGGYPIMGVHSFCSISNFQLVSEKFHSFSLRGSLK